MRREQFEMAVVDPAGLTDQTKEYAEDYAEEPMVEFGGIKRMVNRNDDAVTATMVAGEYLYGRGVFAPGFGTTLRSGRFLRADQPCGTVSVKPKARLDRIDPAMG